MYCQRGQNQEGSVWSLPSTVTSSWQMQIIIWFRLLFFLHHITIIGKSQRKQSNMSQQRLLIDTLKKQGWLQKAKQFFCILIKLQKNQKRNNAMFLQSVTYFDNIIAPSSVIESLMGSRHVHFTDKMKWGLTWIQQNFMCFHFIKSQTMTSWGHWITNSRKWCLEATPRPLAEL